MVDGHFETVCEPLPPQYPVAAGKTLATRSSTSGLSSASRTRRRFSGISGFPISDMGPSDGENIVAETRS